jgi:hypothetical protein
LSLYVEETLGYHGQGDYGLDTVGLGWGSDVPSVANQVIAGIATPQFYLGSLGLDIRPFNFSNLQHPIPSLLGTLVERRMLPSASWAYTAGSFNHAPATYGSLTLGGYDRSRFVPNDVFFPFGTDIAVGLVLSLQRISTNITNTTTLLDTPIFPLINTVMSHLWLPEVVCEAFATAYGLSYDSSLNIYFVNDSIHTDLLNVNPVVSFTLATSKQPDTNETVQIQVPYSSLALRLEYPYVPANHHRRYFPIRRAASDAQYTLGRAFLQDAYVIVDYDRQRFSVSQAVLPASANGLVQDLVAIRRPNATADGSDDNNNSAASASLELPEILGISIGMLILIVLSLSCVFAMRRRRRKHRQGKDDTRDSPKIPVETAEMETVAISGPVEASGQAVHPDNFHQLHSEERQEMADVARMELGRQGQQMVEVNGVQTPPAELALTESQHEVPVKNSMLHRGELESQDRERQVFELDGDSVQSRPMQLDRKREEK